MRFIEFNQAVVGEKISKTWRSEETCEIDLRKAKSEFYGLILDTFHWLPTGYCAFSLLKVAFSTFGVPPWFNLGSRGGAFDSAKNHKRQRRKRQSVTAKREKSQTPKCV